MTDDLYTYAVGDWIVHRRFGVGQILAMEVRCISGQKTAYYKMKTCNSLIWLPVDKNSVEKFRPLSSPNEFRHALEILRRPPRKMASNFNTRRNRIKEVRLSNSPQAEARLLRDLWGRRTRRKTLSNTESDALRHFTERFLSEWSACMGLEISEVRRRLYAVLGQK